MSDHIETLKQKRRDLDRQIKAAQRAETKRLSEELLSAKHQLGVRLTTVHEADTPEAITALGDLLVEDKVRAYITKKLAEMADSVGDTSTPESAETSDTFVTTEESEVLPQGQAHDYQSSASDAAVA